MTVPRGLHARPTLWRNARVATCDTNGRVLDRGALLTHSGRIAWLGSDADLLPPTLGTGFESRDLEGAWITPGLIDCHTHLVFAGTRASEHADLVRGVSYEDIERRGAGILTTVKAVRTASEQQLVDESAPRLEALRTEGVTTVEIKSGYGLTLEDQAKMLRAARRAHAAT